MIKPNDRFHLQAAIERIERTHDYGETGLVALKRALHQHGYTFSCVYLAGQSLFEVSFISSGVPATPAHNADELLATCEAARRALRVEQR